MSAKHTPAPWQAIGTDPAEGGDWFWINAQPNPAMRGFTKNIGVINGSQTDPERQANALLAAAAPELLEALEGLLDGLPFAPTANEYELVQAGCDPTEARRLAAAFAAIAKAKGGEA